MYVKTNKQWRDTRYGIETTIPLDANSRYKNYLILLLGTKQTQNPFVPNERLQATMYVQTQMRMSA